MSRIAKHPVELPSGVEAKITARSSASRSKRANSLSKSRTTSRLKPRRHADKSLEGVDNRNAAMMWGTTASLVRGMIKGVSEGYKRLIIEGVVSALRCRARIWFSRSASRTKCATKFRKASKSRSQADRNRDPRHRQAESRPGRRRAVPDEAPPSRIRAKGINYEGRHIRRKRQVIEGLKNHGIRNIKTAPHLAGTQSGQEAAEVSNRPRLSVHRAPASTSARK